MNKNLVMVFTRNPELGKVKTRLAKTIGDQSALNVYKFLLEHTEKTIRLLNCDKAVFYSVEIRHNDLWDKTIYQKYQQQGDDLGNRMSNAFQHAFEKDYEKVVIVGSDLFDLKTKHIEDAFSKLNNHDVVIGPAKDGGYYLLGLKNLHADIFSNKVWGTDSVFKDTLNDLKTESVFLLDQLNDIDTYEDMRDNDILKTLILQND